MGMGRGTARSPQLLWELAVSGESGQSCSRHGRTEEAYMRCSTPWPTHHRHRHPLPTTG